MNLFRRCWNAPLKWIWPKWGFQPLSPSWLLVWVHSVNWTCASKGTFRIAFNGKNFDRIGGAFIVNFAYCHLMVIYIQIEILWLLIHCSYIQYDVIRCMHAYSFTSFSYVNLLLVRPQKRIIGIINATHTCEGGNKRATQTMWYTQQGYNMLLNHGSNLRWCIHLYPWIWLPCTKFGQRLIFHRFF